MAYNKVLLIGNLGKDPVIKYTQNKKAYAFFPLATSEKFKDKSGNTETKTTWHNVVCWGQRAEVCEKYLHKGSKAFVTGKIVTEEYMKNDEKRYITKIVADQVIFLDPKEKQEESKEIKADPFPDLDDVPF